MKFNSNSLPRILFIDLDKTLYDCYDRNGNPIWGKQLIPPFFKDKDVITDDVYSRCVLRPNVRVFLESMSQIFQCHYITHAGYFGLPMANQPSRLIMESFGLSKYFVSEGIIYKDESKSKYIDSFDTDYVLIDDSQLNLLEASSRYKFPIDSSKITDWLDISTILQHYLQKGNLEKAAITSGEQLSNWTNFLISLAGSSRICPSEELKSSIEP